MHATHASGTVGVTLCVHGPDSQVTLRGCSITDENREFQAPFQGVLVHSGGSFTAVNTTFLSLQLGAVAAHDKNSKIDLHGCMVNNCADISVSSDTDMEHEQKPQNAAQFTSHTCSAVVVSAGADAVLANTRVLGGFVGILVQSSSRAKLLDSTVSRSANTCVLFRSGSFGNLQSCEVSGSMHGDGMSVSEGETKVSVALSHFAQNADCGVSAHSGAEVSIIHCMSFSNKSSGFQVHGEGSRMFLMQSSSNSNRIGFEVAEHAELSSNTLQVRTSTKHGIVAGIGSKVNLMNCEVVGCNVHGVHAFGTNCMLSMHGCSIGSCLGCGILVDPSAAADVTKCFSSQNLLAGFKCQNSGTLTLINCESNEDRGEGCVCDEGMMCLKGVRVGGVEQSSIML